MELRFGQLGALLQMPPLVVPVRRFEVAGGALPAAARGSEYHDVIPRADGLWLGIGDVSGESFGAGLIMLMVRSGLGTVLRARTELAPGEAVRGMNEVLVETVQRGLSHEHQINLTVLRAADDGTIAFAGGAQQLIVWRAGPRRCEMIPTSRPSLGLESGVDFPDTSLRLHPGDTILLHTGGVTQAASARNGAIGLQRLVDWFGEEGGRPVEEIRDRLVERVRSWHPHDHQATLLVARYRDPAG
jgi:sigma-B regulation protein RsbU (phosphoserine phosphatase)